MRKNWMLWVGAIVVAYLGWRWWQSRQTTGNTTGRDKQGSAFNATSGASRRRKG